MQSPPPPLPATASVVGLPAGLISLPPMNAGGDAARNDKPGSASVTRRVMLALAIAGGMLGLVAVAGIVAALVIPPMNGEGRPLDSPQALQPRLPTAAAASAASPRQLQLAVMRKLVQDKAPGTYTEADFDAAEKAAITASTDQVAIKAYAQVLKARLRR